MSLTEGFIDFAERTYAIDWSAIQQAVAARLRLTASFDRSLYDPMQYPAYWCVPSLVGSYVGASENAVLVDTETFVCGCIVRHCVFDANRPFNALDDEEVLRAILSAYDGCRIGAESSFDLRFAAKSLPWKILLTLGTRSIADEAGEQADYVSALKAIVRVYSCLQVVDDWHDKAEDVARGHWNMWVHEPARASLSVIEPLMRGALESVERIRPHLLQRALALQFRDTAAEVAEIVTGPDCIRVGLGRRRERWLDDAIAAGTRYLRRSLETETAGLWRDFVRPGISAGSSECVSAFIAAQIGAIPEGRQLAASVVKTVVAHARHTGGWGYRDDVPEDCDSTAWVLLAADAAGVELPLPLLRRSIRFIVRHRHRDGGFVTYGSAAKKSLTPADQSGWYDAEVSVTASAVLALSASRQVHEERLARALEFIWRSCRNELWESYWWKGFGYATYHSLAALSNERSDRYKAQLTATKDAVLERRSTCGGWATELGAATDGFSTSFALRVLLIADESRAHSVAISEGASYLGGLITASGAAPPGAEMLAPGAVNGSDLMLRDNGNVTTACVIRALHEVRARLAERRRGL